MGPLKLGSGTQTRIPIFKISASAVDLGLSFVFDHGRLDDSMGIFIQRPLTPYSHKEEGGYKMEGQPIYNDGGKVALMSKGCCLRSDKGI